MGGDGHDLHGNPVVAPVANERPCATWGAYLAVPNSQWRDFEIQGSSKDTRQPIHGEIAIFKTSHAAGHVGLAKNTNGRRARQHGFESLIPGSLAIEVDTRFYKLVRGPWQNDVDGAATGKHCFKEQDIRATCGAPKPNACIHGLELL